MEQILNLTLFGSFAGFCISLILLFVILIISELESFGFLAFFSFLCFVIFNYYFGNLPLFEIITLRNIGVYTSVGFIFAIIRTYFKGRELEKEDKKYFKLKDAIFMWWFLFPISAINWIFGRLLKDLYNFIYIKFQKFFEYVFNFHS